MLTLQREPFRFAGTNLYWLGLDENVRGTDHPTYFRIDDALKAARIMNASVVRSHTLGTSLGCAPCIQPGPGEFNNDAFAPIDYTIARARAYGLRLIVPLTDQWGYYHGEMAWAQGSGRLLHRPQSQGRVQGVQPAGTQPPQPVYRPALQGRSHCHVVGARQRTERHDP